VVDEARKVGGRSFQTRGPETSLFVVVVHGGCDKQDSLMPDGLCGKLHGRPSLLFALAVIDPIARYSSRIAIAYPTGIRHPRLGVSVGILQ